MKLDLRFGPKIRQTCLRISDGREEGNVLEASSLQMLFLHHLLQLRCNSHSVSEVVECGEGGEFLGSAGVTLDGPIKSMRPVSFGTVLLPTASLMNHSCSPNAFFR